MLKLKGKCQEIFNIGGELKPVLGDPYKIELMDDIPVKPPSQVNVPGRTPYAFQIVAVNAIHAAAAANKVCKADIS